MSGVPTVEPEEGWSPPDSAAEAMVAGAAHGMILPARQRRPWLLGALVCVVAAVSTFVPVFAMTGPPPNAVPDPPVAAPTGAPDPLAGDTSGRTFTHVPEQCALLSPETVTRYLPGTTCNPNAYQPAAGKGAHGMWGSPPSQVLSSYINTSVLVLLSPIATRSVFNQMKNEAATMFTGLTVTDSRPVTDLGEDAYLVYGTYSLNSRAYLLVIDGNAGITIDHSASVRQQPVPQEQAEAAVIAMAHDVIRSLR